MERYENIEKRLQKELSKIDKKLENDGSELSSNDLELVDCIFHALKSAEGYYAMAESEDMGYSGNEYSGRSNNSYARGRDSRGRYASRDDGYSGGYYPPMPMRSRYPSYGSYDDGMSMRY